MTESLRAHALTLLREPEAAAKRAGLRRLRAAPPPSGAELALNEPDTALPGRPARPLLCEHLHLPKRSAHTVEGRAALLHAIAHIEFNAINLALDAIWRFPGLPDAYYLDWLQVADEEALHFELLQQHLRSLGKAYGDFDAHDGLWAMCDRTKHSFRARMALVPRTLEARGLDATPPLQRKLAQAGDTRAVEILDIILRDEIGHVAIGNRWYRWACEQDGVTDMAADFAQLCQQHQAPRPRPPLNLGARALAGFSAQELESLQLQAASAAPAA
ncbi:ferritin-like domain-containing protein [Inhella sp.]|uniref:ferritin-like domain-containing protein n=1 Tax=Inhella sp. TaxID=1921806 RepID=UPI0035B216E4